MGQIKKGMIRPHFAWDYGLTQSERERNRAASGFRARFESSCRCRAMAVVDRGG